MRHATSEIIFGILKYSFPRSPDSKLARLAEKLQRKLGAEEQHLLAAQKRINDMATTLLFADGNQELVRTATAYMKEIRPQWRFLAAHSLADARRIYNQCIPHAAVLDVGLPDGSGLDLLSEFKHRRPEFPVIIISGDDSATISQAVLARGGYSFLPKPFSTPVLVRQIESAIFAFQEAASDRAEPSPDLRGPGEISRGLASRPGNQNLTIAVVEKSLTDKLLLK